jgi:hypothetical protein
VDDDRGLLDRRQTLLDPIGEHRPGEGPELAEVAGSPLAAGERNHQCRLMRSVSQRAEDLVARGAPGRVDRWAYEHHRTDPQRSPHRQLGDDLAAHRIGNERWPLEPDLVQPGSERIGEAADPELTARLLASSVSREVRRECRAARGEHARERQHVAARDTVSVHQYHRRPLSPRVGMHPYAGHLVPPAFERGRHPNTHRQHLTVAGLVTPRALMMDDDDRERV